MQFDVLDPRTRLRHCGIRRGIQRGRLQALRAASPSDASLAPLIWLSILFQFVERDLVSRHRAVPTSMSASSLPRPDLVPAHFRRSIARPSGACISAHPSSQHVSLPPLRRRSLPRSLPHLFIFALIYFYFICRRKSRLSPAGPQRRDATRRDVDCKQKTMRHCGNPITYARMSTCTRRSYARRSKYGNAFTRGVFTRLSRNTESARGTTLTVYKQP